MRVFQGAGRPLRAVGRAIGVAAFAAAAGACGYGEMVELEGQVQAAASEVLVQAARRVELAGNLLEALGAPAWRGEPSPAEVGGARLRLAGALAREEWPAIDRADRELSDALVRWRAGPGGDWVRRPSDWAARLFAELDETEARLAEARQAYNGAAREYNEYIREFPRSLTARVLGAHDYPLLEEEAGAETPSDEPPRAGPRPRTGGP